MRYSLAVIHLTALGLLGACGAGEVLTMPVSGELTVTVTTAGNGPDPDGYFLAVDGGTSQPLTATDTLTIPDLDPGEHRVELSGIAPNCLVSGSNPVTVTVIAGSPVAASFEVSCVASPATGSLVVQVATTGTAPDSDGYLAVVDSLPPEPLGIAGSVTFEHLAAGPHAVRLGGIARTCEVRDQNPRTVDVSSEPATTLFEVSCWPLPRGVVAFHRQRVDPETGDDLFLENADGTGLRNLTGTPDISEGSPVWSPDGSTLAFHSGFAVFVVSRNGEGLRLLAGGLAPVWSPDGQKILIHSGNAGLQVVTLADGHIDIAVSDAYDGFTTGAAWSPDAKRIVVGLFSLLSSAPVVQLVDPDGSHPRTLADPSILPGGNYFVFGWSPDGTKIAVVVSNPFADLFLIDTTTSQPPLNLTRDQADYRSVRWSPDGSMLLFIKTAAGAPFGERDIYTLRLNSMALTRLTSAAGPYADAAWSPDGAQVVFAVQEGLFFGPSHLFIVNADGSGLRQLTAGGARDGEPSWAP